MKDIDVIPGLIINEHDPVSLAELCRCCSVSADWIMALVDEGILELLVTEAETWQFSGISVLRVQIIRRLQRDLGVNLAGAALALELLDEIERLRQCLQRFKI